MRGDAPSRLLRAHRPRDRRCVQIPFVVSGLRRAALYSVSAAPVTVGLRLDYGSWTFPSHITSLSL